MTKPKQARYVLWADRDWKECFKYNDIRIVEEITTCPVITRCKCSDYVKVEVIIREIPKKRGK